MTPRRFCSRPYDDRGTSLVLAPVFITIGSLAVMTVFALADTSMKSAIALRSLASEMAAAEGAANLAINTLRDGDFGGPGNCFGASSTLTLSNFYQRPDGSQDSARVTCALDPTSTTAPIGTPPRALLTLDTTASGLLGPFGISVTTTQNTNPGSLRVTGAVHSNSNIVIQPRIPFVVQSGNLTSSGAIRANLSCSSGTGFYSPTPTCSTGTVIADPAYPPPLVAGLPTRTVPACAAVMTFDPGRYIDVANLSHRTSALCQGGNAVLHFRPGVYYFQFDEFGPPGANLPWVWAITRGTVIGGALRAGVTLAPGMSLSPTNPNCVSPVPTGPGWLAPLPDNGVTFVFSGRSQMNVAGSAKVELCGRYGGRSAAPGNPMIAPIAVTAQPATGTLATLCASTAWPCAPAHLDHHPNRLYRAGNRVPAQPGVGSWA